MPKKKNSKPSPFGIMAMMGKEMPKEMSKEAKGKKKSKHPMQGYKGAK